MTDKQNDIGYFDKPKTKSFLWKLLLGACILFVVLEFFIERHGHFGDHSIDSYFGFFGILGFLACLICILVGKALSSVLKAKESFYDRDIV